MFFSRKPVPEEAGGSSWWRKKENRNRRYCERALIAIRARGVRRVGFPPGRARFTREGRRLERRYLAASFFQQRCFLLAFKDPGMGAMRIETLAFWGGGSGLEMHTRGGPACQPRRVTTFRWKRRYVRSFAVPESRIQPGGSPAAYGPPPGRFLSTASHSLTSAAMKYSQNRANAQFHSSLSFLLGVKWTLVNLHSPDTGGVPGSGWKWRSRATLARIDASCFSGVSQGGSLFGGVAGGKGPGFLLWRGGDGGLASFLGFF